MRQIVVISLSVTSYLFLVFFLFLYILLSTLFAFGFAALTALAFRDPNGASCARTSFDYSLLVLSKLSFHFSVFRFF